MGRDVLYVLPAIIDPEYLGNKMSENQNGLERRSTRTPEAFLILLCRKKNIVKAIFAGRDKSHFLT